MTIMSLGGRSVGISYSFDDSGVWSTPENYPLGKFEVVIPARQFADYAAPGLHKVTFRFEEVGNHVSEKDWIYTVNSPPALTVTDAQPLALKGAPTGPVSLPLSVHDADGDEVGLWYRFDGQGDWIYADAGANALPPEAFAGLENGATGYVEVAGWDGYEHSDERVRIGYAIEGEAQSGGDGAFFGGALSPAALVGIAVGGLALISLVIAIIVVATRKKPQSSSTGLLESE